MAPDKIEVQQSGNCSSAIVSKFSFIVLTASQLARVSNEVSIQFPNPASQTERTQTL